MFKKSFVFYGAVAMAACLAIYFSVLFILYYVIPPTSTACLSCDVGDFAPFLGTSAVCNSTGVYFLLYNGAGRSATFFNATVSTSNGITTSAPQWPISYDMNNTIISSTRPVFCGYNLSGGNCSKTVLNGEGAHIKLSGICEFGSRYSASIAIWYSSNFSGRVVYGVATGTISGTAT